MIIDTDAANDPCSATNTAVPAEFASRLDAERFIGNARHVSCLNNLRHRSATLRISVLTAVVLVVFTVVGPVAFHIGGPIALAAAATAAGLCLIGAGAALMIARLLSGPNLALIAMMTSMMARMAIPLAFGMTLHLLGGPLAKAGLLYYLLVFYPVTLSVETMLSLPPAEQSKGAKPETAKV